MEVFECYTTPDNIQYAYLFDRTIIMYSHQLITTFLSIRPFAILYRLSLILSIPSPNMINTTPIYKNRYLNTKRSTKIFIIEDMKQESIVYGYNHCDITNIKCYIIPVVLRCILDHIEEIIEDLEECCKSIKNDISYQNKLQLFLTYIEISQRYPTDLIECIEPFL